MRYGLKGFSKIFSFTFRQHALSKGYKNSTIIIGILCLLLPAIIMTSVEASRMNKKDNAAQIGSGTNEEYTASKIKQVLVVDNSNTAKIDLSFLNTIGKKGFENINYESYNDVKKAEEAAYKSDGHTLIMAIDEKDGAYNVSLIKPEGTKLKGDDVGSFQSFINETFSLVLVQKSGLDNKQLVQMAVPITVEAHVGGTAGEEADGGYTEAKEVMGMVVPYLNIMVLYFMILIYGQGVSNSVIMEKTSKLMDTFLIAVKPWAMVMGKVLAIALTGIVQLAVWIAGLVCSFSAGTLIVKSMNPDTEMGVIQLFKTFGSMSGMFTIPGIILAIFIILSGFLLYCAIASIGGSMASKPEDLSSTNMIFTMALIISFLCTMYAGGLNGGMSSSAEWLNWFPLTAILVTPSRVLVGKASLLTGLCSMVIVLICSVLIVVLAGKIYKMMSLYKGNPPNIKKVFGMLKQKS
jgi:ABC-type Na+ efflux pump permease subunit